MAENTNNDSSVQVDEKMIIDDIQKVLKFEFTRDILIKPLPVEYVEKEITEPVATGKKDKDGVDKYDTKTEVKKVPTTFRKGIVLAIPSGYEWQDKNNHPEVGDTIAFPAKAAAYFDLFKDSQLVNPYNVVAFIKKSNA